MSPRATKKLTKSVVDALRPAERDYFVWDAMLPGFGIRVHPNGRMAFVLKFQLGGRTANGGRARRLTIGDFPSLTVDQARRLATEARAKVLRGVDPVDERAKAQGAIRERSLAPTMERLAADYITDRREAVAAGELKTITVEEYDRILRVNVVPMLGATKAREVTRGDVQALWRSLKDRPTVARRAVRILGQAFAFAIDTEWGKVVSNPCHRALRRLAPRKKGSSGKSLSVEQYGQLGTALSAALESGLPPDPRLAQKKRGMSLARQAKLGKRPRREKPYNRTKETELTPADPLQVAAVQFAALTGWRRKEVWSLAWSEVRLNDAVAMLEDSKTGKSLRPLGTAAVEILESVQSLTNRTEKALVFSLQASVAKRPEARHLWYAVRHAAALTIRFHDLRHSWITMCRRLGYHDGIIAAAIGHTGGNMTAKYGEIPLDQVRAAVDDTANAIARAMRGEVAEILELTKPKSRLKVIS